MLEVRDGQVDPDGRLDGEHQHQRGLQLFHGQQQHQEDRADGDEVHLDHVLRDGVHQVVGADPLPGQVVVVPVVLGRRFPDLFHQVEGLLPFIFHAHRQQHPTVAVAPQQLEGGVGHQVGRDGGAEDVGQGGDGDDVVVLLQRLAQGALGLIRRVRHHEHVSVLDAEGVLDHGGVVPVLGARPEDVGRTIVVVVLVAEPEGGEDEQAEQDGQRDGDLGHPFAEGIERRQEAPVGQLIHEPEADQNDAGHEEEHGQQTDAHALGQRSAQVGADAEAHEEQGDEANDGGQTAGQDGGGGFAQRLLHGRLGVRVLQPALAEPVDEEDRVVQGHGQL